MKESHRNPWLEAKANYLPYKLDSTIDLDMLVKVTQYAESAAELAAKYAKSTREILSTIQVCQWKHKAAEEANAAKKAKWAAQWRKGVSASIPVESPPYAEAKAAANGASAPAANGASAPVANGPSPPVASTKRRGAAKKHHGGKRRTNRKQYRRVKHTSRRRR